MIQDLRGIPADRLLNKRLFLLDMDGTIYEENRIFDGTLDFLHQIRESGGEYVFLTNNSSRSLSSYLEKVHGMGIPAEERHFFTSVQASIYLLNRDYPGIKVYCMGTQSMISELRSAGVEVTEEEDSEAGLILIGFDRELTHEKLRKTCRMLNHGLPYFATNPDWVCPTSWGFEPDCGSMAQMLEHATGRMPVFIGKPEPMMAQLVMQKYGISENQTVMIGDRLYTDIESGRRAGIDTICVLSGESGWKDLETSSSQPTWVFQDVSEIAGMLKTGR